MWRRGEDLGFDHLWTYDHLTWDPLAGTPWGATMPTLVAAAGVTSPGPARHLGGVAELPSPRPVRAELAALDDVSGGRGVARHRRRRHGPRRPRPGRRRLAPADRAARLEEFVDLLDRVLVGTTSRSPAASTRRSTPGRRSRCVSGPGCRSSSPPTDRGMLRLAARVGQGWATTGARAGRGRGRAGGPASPSSRTGSPTRSTPPGRPAGRRRPDALDRRRARASPWSPPSCSPTTSAGPASSGSPTSSRTGRAGARSTTPRRRMVETVAGLLPGLR